MEKFLDAALNWALAWGAYFAKLLGLEQLGPLPAFAIAALAMALGGAGMLYALWRLGAWVKGLSVVDDSDAEAYEAYEDANNSAQGRGYWSRLVEIPWAPAPGHVWGSEGWVNAQILAAQDYGDPELYLLRQAYRKPWVLLRRWRHINAVYNWDTLDAYATAAGWGIAMGALVGVGLGAVIAQFGGGEDQSAAILLGLTAGTPAAGLGFYRWMVKIMWYETYLDSVSSQYRWSNRRPRTIRLLLCYLTKLGLAHRPEVLQGLGGRNGFRDKNVRAHLRLEFGQQVQSMRHLPDYYALPIDWTPQPLAHNVLRYSFQMLVDEAGSFYRRFMVPLSQLSQGKGTNAAWPYVIATLGYLGGLFLAFG